MPRIDRLFRLLQAFRTLPAPVTAARLAQETGVSQRSIYRDIESLRASGVDIGGERGLGYCLVDDGTLPPQMFSRIEIEALALGLAEVRQMGDPALAAAAAIVLGKVAATLPSARQQQLLHTASQVHHFERRYPAQPYMALLRESCWREEALRITYTDKGGISTDRIVWPLAVVYLKSALVLLAQCRLRDDFRMFRAERIVHARTTGTTFRPKRVALLRAFLAELQPDQRGARPVIR